MIYDSSTNCTSCTSYTGITNGTENINGCNRCLRGLIVLVGIISGLIFSAAYTLLYVFGFLSMAYVGIAVALGTAVVYLFVILIGSIIAGLRSDTARLSECIYCNIGSLFFGILGTIIAGILALSAGIAGVTVLGAVLVALTAFFFAYMLITIFFLVRCLVFG